MAVFAATFRVICRENDVDLIIVRIVILVPRRPRSQRRLYVNERAIRRHCSRSTKHSDARRSRPRGLMAEIHDCLDNRAEFLAELSPTPTRL